MSGLPRKYKLKTLNIPDITKTKLNKNVIYKHFLFLCNDNCLREIKEYNKHMPMHMNMHMFSARRLLPNLDV